MTRLLITGATGLLGARACLLAAQAGHPVLGVARNACAEMPGVELVSADLSSQGAADEIAKDFRPDWIIHCAALPDIDRCEREPEEAHLQNVGMTEWVAQAADRSGARLAFISTDVVFDGGKGDWREEDRPAPLNVYGHTKVAGEKIALTQTGNLVLRANIYGWNLQPKFSLAEAVLDAVTQARAFPAFEDVSFTPLLTDHFIPLMFALMERGASGIFHMGGGEAITKFEFARQVALAFGHDASLVMPVRQSEVTGRASRPLRIDMNMEKTAGTTGMAIPDIQTGLRAMRQTYDDGSACRLRSMYRAHVRPS